MIIDIHGHLQAPPQLHAYAQSLLNTRGMEGKDDPGISDEALEAVSQATLKLMDGVGTDVRFTSPRPYLMHSEQPARVVHWWIEALNNVIARECKAHPDRMAGIGALPQVAGESIDGCLEELERTILGLGFVGVSVNPDPGEGLTPTPPMGHEYWYPLYERCVALDVPILVHSASCRNERESYLEHFITEDTIAALSLCRSRVFQDFPSLKIIIPHGGGSVPYQIGRWRSVRHRPDHRDSESFDASLRKLYFDTCLYTQSAIDLLLREVGVDRCMFGTEKPGVGSQVDNESGEWFDDIKPKIERIEWLTDADRKAVFEDTARRVFTRWKPASR